MAHPWARLALSCGSDSFERTLNFGSSSSVFEAALGAARNLVAILASGIRLVINGNDFVMCIAVGG